jgi:HEAT repeat protein
MSDLNQAFEALSGYGPGSGRAALLPIDQAARASLADTAARQDLERRLLTALQQAGSVAAREYICSKLVLIGSEQCVPAVGELLPHPLLSTAARTVIENLPSSLATKVLRDHLGKVTGLQKAGLICSLGARRDAGSASALEKLLKDEDASIAGAAAGALGEIGTVRAGRALVAFLKRALEPVRAKAAEAVLLCAERLLAAGREADARVLYGALVSKESSGSQRDAALRGLQALAAEPRKASNNPN